MSQEKILIVEDESVVALDLKQTLETMGYRVAAMAASGEEAVLTAEKERPALVLMDIVLAGILNGIDAAGQIYDRFDIPVLYLTAYSDDFTLKRAKSTRPFGYILKPFQKRELQSNIEIALYKHASENKIKENERWLNSILKSIGEAVIATDREGRIKFLNLVAEVLTGWDKEEALGRSLGEVFRTVDSLTGKEEDLSGEAWRGEEEAGWTDHTFLITRNGARKSIDRLATRIQDDRGNLMGALLVFRDISEKKRAEEDLRRSEERYRTVADYTFHWEYWISPEGNMVYVSPSCERITGYPREAFLKDPAFLEKIVHPKDLFLVTSHRAEAMREGGGRPVEFRIIRRDGEVRWVEHNCQKVYGWDGRFLGMRASNSDITERKLAEESLRKSEERFRLLYQGLPLGYQSLDLEGRLVEVNQAWLETLGYGREEVLGRWFGSFLHPSARDRFQKKFTRFKVTGKIHGLEFEMVRKDGSVIVASFDGRVGNDERGRFKQTHCLMNNVTERRAAQEALRRSEEKYRTLVENANDAIYIAQEETLKFANRKTREMLEYSAEELARIPFAEHIHAGDLDMVLEMGRRRLAGEQMPGTSSFRVITKTGRQLWAESNAVLIEWEGKPATLNFTRDITEQRQMEAKFLQAQKMEAVGQLAGGIAHDFNNALTLISVCSQLALLELEADSPVREKLETIHASTEHSAYLSRQLLAFSRRQVMEMKVFDLNLLLKDLERMLSRVIGENIQLNLFLNRDLGFIESDTGQVEQAILNLVVNARDAMPEGGSLTIETANADLGGEAVRERPEIIPGRYVALSVSDTGMGMSPEVARRVFEPFFTTKEQGKGTGLGLAMVYGIVKQSKGYIYVDSKPGRGTIFKIYLPRVDKPAEVVEPKVPRKEELPRGGETVLVVEDEKPVRVFVSQVLRKQGYNVVEASGSGEAFLLAERFPKEIDLLLTDVIMPGMSGPELAERLRKVHPEMKLLYMSGYPDETIARRGVLKDGVHFLQKPFTVEGLLAKVRKALGQVPPKPGEDQIKLL